MVDLPSTLVELSIPAMLIAGAVILLEYLRHRHREEQRRRDREAFRHITGSPRWWGQ